MAFTRPYTRFSKSQAGVRGLSCCGLSCCGLSCCGLSCCGLSCCGLSCCVNALLQSFSATAELFDLLTRWQTSDEFEDPHNVPLQLKRTLHAMENRLQSTPHRDFLNCLHRYTELDADEVFHAVLNLIQQQVPDPGLATEIKNLYKITVEGEIHCLKCTYVQRVPTFFLTLPLHLPEDKNTLADCIRSFFEFRKLEDSETFYCDVCEQKQPTTQGFKIVSLPRVLCVHLKRFRSVGGFTRKLSDQLRFPESFNIADIFPEENPTQVMVCLTVTCHPHLLQLEGSYSLYAVIVHSGSPVLGHYTAYIRSTQDQRWYYTDDSFVCQARWEDVQRSYGGLGKTETAYMLLYRRSSSEKGE